MILLLQAATLVLGVAGLLLALRSMECFRLYPQQPSGFLLRQGFACMGGAGVVVILAVPLLEQLLALA